MPGDHGSSHSLDGLAITDVADLVPAADLVRDRAQSLYVARDENAMPAALSKHSPDRRADTGASPGNDCDSSRLSRLHGQSPRGLFWSAPQAAP